MRHLTKRHKPFYKAINHTADFGFDVFGKTRKELFQHAATALFASLTDLNRVQARQERTLTITGADLSDLLINYLRELLYLFTGTAFLVGSVDIVHMGQKSLTMIARGEPYNPQKHEILTEIKAVTYHQGTVRKTPAYWQGRFIVDV
ncbi:MAG: Protein archease [Syntrophus sp. SKADARSKE-3]|nr:Protein archease [Syntrophus sp. SKADARSKE-3]